MTDREKFLLELKLNSQKTDAEEARKEMTEQLETLQLQLQNELQNLKEGKEADLADLDRRLNRAKEVQVTMSSRETALQQLEQLQNSFEQKQITQ